MIDRWRALPPYPRRVLVRLACVPLLWLLGTFAVFMLLHVVPERDLADVIAGQGASPEQVEKLRQELGLNDSYIEQYTRWLVDFLRGDFGTEYYSQKPIRGETSRRADATAEMIVASLFVSAAVSFALAWLSRRAWPYAGVSVRGIMALLAAIPFIVVTVAWIILPAYWWAFSIVPVGGFGSFFAAPWQFVRYAGPTTFFGGVIAAGFTAPAVSRVLRTGDERGRNWRALAVSICSCFPILLSFQVVAEQVLSTHGLGQYMFFAVLQRDLEVVKALFALLLLASFLVWSFHPTFPPNPRDTSHEPAHSISRALLIPGIVLVAVFLLAALIGPLVTSDPRDLSPTDLFEPPSWSHLLGTNSLGQDLLAQVVAACRSSLVFTLAPLLLGLLPGLAIATAARRWSTKAGHFADEAATVWQALPVLPMTLLFMSADPFAFRYEVAAVTIGAFAVGMMLSAHTANLDLNRVEDRWRCGKVIAAGAAIVAASAILLDETLAFMGFGTIPGDSSFGALISESGSYAITYLRLWLIPSLALTAIIIGFMLLRRSLDDEVPPHMYER